jgi:hypothetical protein
MIFAVEEPALRQQSFSSVLSNCASAFYSCTKSLRLLRKTDPPC